MRRAAFATVSAITTTGYRVQELGELTSGTQALLWLLMGAGAMAASVAGGLKIVRLLGVLGYVRRELTRHLHPSSQRAVRVGPSTLSDQVTGRMVGSVTISLLIMTAAAILVAATDQGIIASVSAALGAISNSGLALVPGAEQSYLVDFDPFARWVLAALMALGRIEILPVLVVVADIAARRISALPTRARRNRRRLER